MEKYQHYLLKHFQSAKISTTSDFNEAITLISQNNFDVFIADKTNEEGINFSYWPRRSIYVAQRNQNSKAIFILISQNDLNYCSMPSGENHFYFKAPIDDLFFLKSSIKQALREASMTNEKRFREDIFQNVHINRFRRKIIYPGQIYPVIRLALETLGISKNYLDFLYRKHHQANEKLVISSKDLPIGQAFFIAKMICYDIDFLMMGYDKELHKHKIVQAIKKGDFFLPLNYKVRFIYDHAKLIEYQNYRESLSQGWKYSRERKKLNWLKYKDEENFRIKQRLNFLRAKKNYEEFKNNQFLTSSRKKPVILHTKLSI